MKRDAAKETMDTAPRPASKDAQIETIARFLGLDFGTVQAAVIAFVTLAIEAGAILADVGKGGPKPLEPPAEPRVPVKRRALASPAKINQHDFLRYLKNRADENGEVLTSMRLLAKATGRSSATAHRWAHDLSDAGDIELDTAGGQTRILVYA